MIVMKFIWIATREYIAGRERARWVWMCFMAIGKTMFSLFRKLITQFSGYFSKFFCALHWNSPFVLLCLCGLLNWKCRRNNSLKYAEWKWGIPLEKCTIRRKEKKKKYEIPLTFYHNAENIQSRDNEWIKSQEILKYFSWSFTTTVGKH